MARYIEKVAFQVHYGDFYRITRDSYGVNLSALERRHCSLDKPLERSFASIHKWLHGKFNVNPKSHLLTVHTVTSLLQLPSSHHVSHFSLYGCCLLQMQVWGDLSFYIGEELAATMPGGRPACCPSTGR